MNKLSCIYGSIFKCSSCNKEYLLPWYRDNITRDKIYDYTIIDHSIIQTECPYCNEYNLYDIII